MSTLLAARGMRILQESAARERGKESGGTPPRDADTLKHLTALATLVPAEVLGLHSVLISTARQARETEGPPKTPEGKTGLVAQPRQQDYFREADLDALTLLFWVCVLLPFALALFPGGPLGSRLRTAFIGGAAFVGWTMLQPATAFDAVFPAVPQLYRLGGAIVLAILLIAWAIKRTE